MSDLTARLNGPQRSDALVATGLDTTVFGRVRSAANGAEAAADIAARELAEARERLSRAQRAAMGADEAAGRAIALMGAAVREREALGGVIPNEGSPALDELADSAERARADARASLDGVYDALRCNWLTRDELAAGAERARARRHGG